VTAFELGLAWQADKPPGRYGELAAAAEAHGFDVVSVFADLLYQPPLPALLEMARATSRVRLGAACLNPFTQHPYEIAGGLALLDAVSAGRAYLGLACWTCFLFPGRRSTSRRWRGGCSTPGRGGSTSAGRTG
jgi:alkanesulfonate monooxygenase SsuD/methylene tetrahydromethanopterin reductase-like flavin-dependent oxidoreductase (luciferase family)